MPKEKKATKETHQATVEWLSEEMAKSPQVYGRALDAGGGDGRITQAELAPLFDKADLFDRDQTAVEQAAKLKNHHP